MRRGEDEVGQDTSGDNTQRGLQIFQKMEVCGVTCAKH